MLPSSSRERIMCDFMKENPSINREWGEGHVRDARNASILLFTTREKCTNVERALGIWRPYDIFSIVWHILKGLTFERFWLLSFHEITFSIWCQGGSGAFVTARIQVKWLLAVPRSQKKFMWQRDHALCTKKLCCSSRVGVCASWRSEDARLARGEMPKR